MENFSNYGIKLPEILLPVDGTDLKAWAVIACDQYTQDREYWLRCANNATNKPSTLNIILPEVYLNDSDKSEKIKTIHTTMKEYIDNGVFKAEKNSFIYIERKTAYGRIRHGLIVAVDLEDYEWKPFSTALIRATEATIVERIPPRMEIRRGAPLESPHIMLLVNDPDKILVEAAGENAKKEAPTYSTDLMEDSGSICGWAINKEKDLESVDKALEKLRKANTRAEGDTFMFAVGDGNHSLATAKAVWEEHKSKTGATDGKLRYALVEIVNIYDTGLTFEPIHRVLFNCDINKLSSFLADKMSGKLTQCSNAKELENKVSSSSASFGFVYADKNTGKQSYLLLDTPITDLAVSKLQPLLDEYLKNINTMPKPDIDYIHGTEEVLRLGGVNNAISILLPPIAKDSFFTTIAGTGPLPRKSFSMGEASEKRFYMECRKID